MAQTLAVSEFAPFLITERAGARTPDNLIKSQVLYHLSYTPLLTGLVGFEPTKCRSQSPVPYRLAIAH
jgi:hypothetical protein